MGYTAPNVMESINSGILPDGSVNIVNGTLTQVDPEEPGRFVNSFAGKWLLFLCKYCIIIIFLQVLMEGTTSSIQTIEPIRPSTVVTLSAT